MRATRAYLAGFGTSGSLLAGAALLFLLASAFVGFRGWPAVAQPAAPVSVSVPRIDLGTGSSRTARALAASITSGSPQAVGHGAGRTASPGAHGGTTHGTPSGAGLRGGSGNPPSSSPAGHQGQQNPPPPPSTCSGCSTSPGSNPSTLVQKVIQTVTGARSTVTSTAKGVITTVKKHLPGGGSGVGTTVHRVGSGSGSTITHARGSAGSTVHHLLP